ncbi:MAG: TolC family protein [Myxococcota bacterium]
MTVIIAVSILLLAAASHGESRGLEVGRISDLDLAAVRRIIDESAGEVEAAPTELRVLTLEESLKIALEHNLGLQITALEVEAQGYEIPTARAKFHPTLGLAAAVGDTRIESNSGEVDKDERQSGGAFVRQEIPTGGALTLEGGYSRHVSDDAPERPGDPRNKSTTEGAGARIELRQPLLRGGRIYVARREIMDAEFNLEIRQSQLQAEILEVGAEIKTAYYRTIEAERLIQVIQDAIERDRQLLEYSRALYDAGHVSSRDVLSAELRLAGDETRLAQRRAGLAAAKNELRDALGLPVETQIEIADRSIPFYPVELKLDEWIERAHANRPELMLLRTRLEQSELAQKIRKNALLPSLDVVADYGQGADFKSHDWNVGLALEYPIGNVAARSRLAEAQTEHSRIERQYVQAKRRIERDLRDIEIHLRESLDRLKALANAVEQARTKGKIARARFERGLANNLDITDADEALVNAESQMLRALVAYATNVAVLEARIAGPV